MDAIDEIDGKKKRQVMLENMQRNSALYQSKQQKSKPVTADEAKVPEPPSNKQSDLTDFSAEFSSQGPGLNSQAQSTLLKSWEDILDDDDWLEDDSGNQEDSPQESARQEQNDQDQAERESEAELTSSEDDDASIPKFQAKSAGTGFFHSAFAGSAGAVQEKKPAPPNTGSPASTEESLGFSWGKVSPPSTASASVAPVEASPDHFVPTVEIRLRPPSLASLSPRGQLQQVDNALASAAKLLVQNSEGEPGFEECVRLLTRFGLGALRLCHRSKVKVQIVDQAQFAHHPEIRQLGLAEEDTPKEGAYLFQSRLCLIERECLLQKPRFFHPALYYFAHALDHAQGGEEYSSQKAAAVIACFDSCSNGYNGADFVDELAAIDPVRYFARSVSIYLERDDCDEPSWNLQDLFSLDRSMYDYLEYLFTRFTK